MVDYSKRLSYEYQPITRQELDFAN